MDKAKYTGKVSVEGKEVPFDPVNNKVLDVCHHCGFELEAEWSIRRMGRKSGPWATPAPSATTGTASTDQAAVGSQP